MILDRIIESTKLRVENAKKTKPFEIVKEEAINYLKHLKEKDRFLFEESLKGEELSFICEVKKASPSKGIIAKNFPYVEIAQEYEEARVSAISVLTEPEYFLGDNKYLYEISQNVNIPILRKDFIIDEYQIYEAKTIGASAVLLICSVLDTNILKKYIECCNSLGLSALVEVHNEEEIKSASTAGARVIGVNNRNLKTFEVDIENSIRLRKFVDNNIIFIAESGISTPNDIKRLREANINGVLIGESIMKSKNKKEAIEFLRG